MSIDSIFLFFFIFSMLVTLRTAIKFITSLTQNLVMKLSVRELFLNGMTFSYLITYILS
jgi:hypothetical protein